MIRIQILKPLKKSMPPLLLQNKLTSMTEESNLMQTLQQASYKADKSKEVQNATIHGTLQESKSKCQN